ncbi:MAG: aminotransferase class I/II-fold pyridoxal phosphate-dependent enzyme, partial [Thermoanaerobaculales bacterium]|nr:aminotransferase class I/II-fold pyridoxal phosphate-dependent enzyme [Thermoanaerobaculales bacterium]
MKVPFFRVEIGQDETNEVLEVLRSGWLTTGPRVADFEKEFSRAVGARYAIALNSCTAALHLSLEALGVKPGDGVLMPSVTFAATAEVVRYLGATPILVDCDRQTLNMDLGDTDRKLRAAEKGELSVTAGQPINGVGIIPVHV